MAKARSWQLYDVENRIVVHAILAPFRTGEQDLARQPVQAFLRQAAVKIATIMLFDHGYRWTAPRATCRSRFFTI